MKFLLILLFAIPVFAQPPTYGELSEIEGKTVYYLVADDSRVRAVIEKEIGSLLKPARDPEKAELFVEYKVLAREETNSIWGQLETGELRVYYYRDKKQIVVWSESMKDTAVPKGTPRKLAKKLRSALKKSSN